MLRTLLPGRSPGFYHNVWGVVFVLPAAALLLMFNVYPLLNALFISTTSWTMNAEWRFVGLDNYVHAFTGDVEFYRSLRTTFLFTVGITPGFALALGLALLFNRNFLGKELFRTIYFAPVVISWVVASMVWSIVFHPSFGLSANIFQLFDQPGVAFLQSTTWVLPALIILSIWKGLGYWMVVFLAGLQNVPRELHEAGSVDGADGWQRFWLITLPLLRPTVLFVCVVGLINAFQVFTPIYIMTRGGPAGASRVFPLLIYENAFSYLKMGYSTALAVVLFVILMAVTLFQLRVLRSEAA